MYTLMHKRINTHMPKHKERNLNAPPMIEALSEALKHWAILIPKMRWNAFNAQPQSYG